MNKPLEVRPDGEAGLFHVVSRSDPQHEEHEVDLRDPLHPLGRCRCKDWTVRIGFPLKNGTVPPRLTCVHVRKVWAYLYQRLHKPH